MNLILSILLAASIGVVILFIIIRLGPEFFNVVSNLFEQWRVNAGERTRRVLSVVDNSTLAGCTIALALGVVALIVLFVFFGVGVLSGPYRAVAGVVGSLLRLLRVAERYGPK